MAGWDRMGPSAQADPECNNTTCLPYAELATLGQKKERKKSLHSPRQPLPIPAAPPQPVPEAISHLLASDQQHTVLLAVLQLPVDVVKHQQLTPAVLQQLHLVTHLKQSGSSTVDTHHAALHSTHPVPGRHPTGEGVPWGEHGELELQKEGPQAGGEELGRWLCRASFKAAQHVSVALAGSYQHGSSPTRHNLPKSHTNFNKMTAGGTRGGCTKGLCVQTAPLDTLKRKKTVPILDSLPRMAGLGGQHGRGGAAGRGTSLCPAAASPALPTHPHTHL